MGKSTINGRFSLATIDFQRVDGEFTAWLVPTYKGRLFLCSEQNGILDDSLNASHVVILSRGFGD